MRPLWRQVPEVLQGELLSYRLFDPDLFNAASELGRRDAERWVDEHPHLGRPTGLPSPGS